MNDIANRMGALANLPGMPAQPQQPPQSAPTVVPIVREVPPPNVRPEFHQHMVQYVDQQNDYLRQNGHPPDYTLQRAYLDVVRQNNGALPQGALRDPAGPNNPLQVPGQPVQTPQLPLFDPTPAQAPPGPINAPEAPVDSAAASHPHTGAQVEAGPPAPLPEAPQTAAKLSKSQLKARDAMFIAWAGQQLRDPASALSNAEAAFQAATELCARYVS